MRLNIILIFTILHLQLVHGQKIEWVNKIGGIEADFGKSIKVDSSGNVYLISGISHTVYFDTDPDTVSLISALPDVFIAKYSSNGDYIWAKLLGGYYAYPGNFDLDNSGNIYLSGSWTSGNRDEIFIAKLDSDGNFIWQKQLAGDDYNSSQITITMNSAGYFYIAGSFKGRVDFNANPVDTAYMTSYGSSSDIFIAKYDLDGNYQWARRIDKRVNLDRINSIVTDSLGTLYVTGYFQDTINFDPSIDTAYLIPDGGGYSNRMFLAKYDYNGNYIWAKATTRGFSGAYSMVIDDNDYLYITGWFGEVVDFDLNNDTAIFTPATMANPATRVNDAFIAKYDWDGNYQWLTALQSNSHRTGFANEGTVGRGINLDAQGNIYVTGFFQDSTDLDPGQDTAKLVSNGGGDVFVAKFDHSGNYKWARSFGGLGYDTGLSIVTDPQANVYCAGYFVDTCDFGGDESLISYGDNDIFIVKYSPIETAIEENYSTPSINVFPNPTSGTVTLKVQGISGQVSLRLYDTMGKQVFKQTFDASQFHTGIPLDLNGLPGSIFFLNVTTEAGSRVMKIAKY